MVKNTETYETIELNSATTTTWTDTFEMQIK